MGGNGKWLYDSRSSKEWKRDWIEGKTVELVKRGHSKQYARAKAKFLYRELSR